jgi:hypothetical protein
VTITEPATGPVLPALPMPLLGVTPSALQAHDYPAAAAAAADAHLQSATAHAIRRAVTGDL